MLRNVIGLALLFAAIVGAMAWLRNELQAQRFGPFLHFTGPGSGYVEVPHDPALNPTDAITIEAWVYLKSYRVHGTEDCCPTFVGKNYQTSYWLGHSNGHFYFYAHGAGSDLGEAAQIPLNTWTHIAVTYDGTTQRHYMNGALVFESSEKPGPLISSTDPLRIGNDISWDSSPDGYIEEVRIWNVVRTQEQIQQKMTTEVPSGAPGLVGMWHLDGDAQDSSANGFHGTLVGNAEFTSTTNAIVAETSDVDIDGEGGVGIGAGSTANGDFIVGDAGVNRGRRSIIKFKLSELPGLIHSATLKLTLVETRKDQFPAPGIIDTEPPFTNPGLGHVWVIHITDYGEPDAADYNAPSISNDPGILIESHVEPQAKVTIDVTAAVLQAQAAGSSFVAFRIQTETETDNDSLNDSWAFVSANSSNSLARPVIEYTLSNGAPSPSPIPSPGPGLPIEGQLGPCLAVTNVAYSLDNEDKEWKAFQPGVPDLLQTLTGFVAGSAYFVNTSANCTLSSGPNVVNLYAGWNGFGWR